MTGTSGRASRIPCTHDLPNSGARTAEYRGCARMRQLHVKSRLETCTCVASSHTRADAPHILVASRSKRGHAFAHSVSQEA
eukprot:1843834-Pleurochrysis_carterae.AAC.1